jgi:predicted Zn-dependent peptidase
MSTPVHPPFIHRRISGLKTVVVGAWVLHGSAHDPAEVAGATHLVEHLTLRRCGGRDRRELAALVDRLGGDVDAWTSTEGMGLSIHTTTDALGEAVALLRDALLTPTFDPADVELERQVALAELELMADDPGELVEDAILHAAWGTHPVARPIIGSRETLVGLTPEALREHHEQRLLAPGRVMIAAIGDVDGEEVLQGLAGLPAASSVAPAELPPVTWSAGHERIARAVSDQVHVRLAFPSLASGDLRMPRLAVLNRVLGSGASSRLFQRLRETEGLTYDIWSEPLVRRTAGLMEIGWASSPEREPEIRRLVLEEIDRLPRDLGDEEVSVAVEGAIRGLVMDAETPGGLLSMEVTEFLERGDSFDLERTIARLRAVTAAEVRALAAEILHRERMASAECGPARESNVA